MQEEVHNKFYSRGCAKVGKYAAENGIVMAQRHYKDLKLGESTVRYFKKISGGAVKACER